MRRSLREAIDKDIQFQFLVEVVLGLYGVAVVVLCWSSTVWTFVLLAAGLFGQFLFWRGRADVVAMAVAAVLGTVTETVCVNTGVWTYQAPGLVFGVPVWLPLAWAYLISLFRRAALTVHSFTVEVWPSGNVQLRRTLFGITGVLILVYCLFTILAVSRNFALAYAIVLVPAAIFWHGETDILIFLVGGVLGTLGEYIAVKLGFWEYSYPLLRSVGMPVSLPLAWGLSSVIVGRVARGRQAAHRQGRG